MNDETRREFKEWQKAFKALRVRFEELKATLSSPQVDDEFLDSYVRATDDISLPKSNRLIYLAGSLFDRIGWKGVCQVFERIISEDPNPGCYAAWLGMGMSYMQDTNNAFEDRVRVANDIETILVRARDAVAEQNFSGLSGAFYYNHPLREQNPKVYLEQAIHWFEILVETKVEDDEQDSYSLCNLAHAHFELGNAEKAAALYRQIKLEELEPEGEFGQAIVKERLAKLSS